MRRPANQIRHSVTRRDDDASSFVKSHTESVAPFIPHVQPSCDFWRISCDAAAAVPVLQFLLSKAISAKSLLFVFSVCFKDEGVVAPR